MPMQTLLSAALLVNEPCRAATNTPATDLARLAQLDLRLDESQASVALCVMQDAVGDDSGVKPSVAEPSRASEIRTGETPVLPLSFDGPKPFGQSESWRWSVQAASGSGFGEDLVAMIGGGVSYFMADFVSLDFELNGLYFDQDGPNAAGVNLAMLLRWHFWHNQANTLSLYADAGAGLMVATNDVPEEGSRFNFNPQLGAGVSFDVGGVCPGARLFLGAKWFHVSNARLFDNNPGADSLLAYAALSLPF